MAAKKNIFISTEVEASLEEVKKGFTLELFEALKPPGLPMKVAHFGGCERGDNVRLVLGVFPLSQTWVSDIVESETTDDIFRFVDVGTTLPFPFSYWRHEHIVRRISDRRCVIIDDITYSCRPAFLTSLLFPLLNFQFSYRKKVYPVYF